MTSGRPLADPDRWQRATPLSLVGGVRVAQVVYAVAELGIADLLADGPADVEHLARSAGCDARALGRLLRAAASVGVLREKEPGTYELAAPANLLRSDVPDSQLAAVRYVGRFVAAAYVHVVDSVRTGSPVFDRAFGLPFYEYLDSDSDANNLVYQDAHARDWELATRCAEQLDLSRYRVIADIGGGTGTFLAYLLDRAPHARGILYDRPEALPVGATFLAQKGVRDRVDLVGGDFFADRLPDADLYILKNTLHSLDDSAAIGVLKQAHEAMCANPGAQLLICEHIVSPDSQWDDAKLIDIDMLLIHGGRERTLGEWHDLARAAGLRLGVTGGVLTCVCAVDAAP
nr:methyltransferase [Kibdelosporangium sp. MJ126-NF4]CEL17399.1 O-methyltransferase [Kibdelosporangium sp. MJ126-NF4]CTQ91373.1 O-methyltransferase [Kibdelosporangium sp. MJ126-NF4]